jgi:hypothetical protein
MGSGVISLKSSYWLCVCLLAASLLGELAFFVEVRNQLALDRVVFLVAATGGVLLFSNIARYVGAAFLGLSSLYTIYGLASAPIAVVAHVVATIVAFSGLEIIATYFLAFSGSFSREFKERKNTAPAMIAHIRLFVLILLVALAIALAVRDIFRLVTP